jgi:hypothetical protein
MGQSGGLMPFSIMQAGLEPTDNTITLCATSMQHPIRDWFEMNDGDESDCVIAPSGQPLSVVPPSHSADAILYCTKQHPILNLFDDLGGEPPFGTVLRYGLPSDADAEWLAVAANSRRLLFLGDADAADLLIYAWLREHLAIEYCGLRDTLLEKCGVPFEVHLTIPMNASELAALPLVEQCSGDLQSALGPWCGGLLSSGRKIEIEALFSFATCDPAQIAAAILAKPDSLPKDRVG